MILQDNNPFNGPSFSVSNRLLRFLWQCVYLIFFRASPRPFNVWRVLLLRLFGARVGRGCNVYSSVKVWAPWNLRIGNYSGVGDGVNLYSMDKIEIGDFVGISQGTTLCCGTHDYNSQNFQLVTKPIKIDKYSWICAEAFIHPGVVVPEGVVIGARSVVSKSIPVAWAVYSGNPCKQVALRTKCFFDSADSSNPNSLSKQ